MIAQAECPTGCLQIHCFYSPKMLVDETSFPGTCKAALTLALCAAGNPICNKNTLFPSDCDMLWVSQKISISCNGMGKKCEATGVGTWLHDLLMSFYHLSSNCLTLWLKDSKSVTLWGFQTQLPDARPSPLVISGEKTGSFQGWNPW